MNDFDQFFREHYARVVGSLRLAGGDVSDAEDAAEEAFATAIATVRVLVPGSQSSLSAAAHLNSVFCPPYGAVTAIAPRAAFTGASAP